MSPLLDRIDSPLDGGDHILQKADGADPSAHEATKNCAYDEHYSDREPWEESILEKQCNSVHCAGYLRLRLYTGHDWEHNPRSSSVECGNEAHDADPAEEHEEAELNDCSYRPVVASNLDPSQPSAKATRLFGFRVWYSRLLHLNAPIQRRGRTVGGAAAGWPIAGRRLRPSLPRAPLAW